MPPLIAFSSSFNNLISASLESATGDEGGCWFCSWSCSWSGCCWSGHCCCSSSCCSCSSSSWSSSSCCCSCCIWSSSCCCCSCCSCGGTTASGAACGVPVIYFTNSCQRFSISASLMKHILSDTGATPAEVSKHKIPLFHPHL